MSAATQAAIRGRFNFAGDRSNGGVFSNFDPSLNRQSLAEHPVDVADARRLLVAPRLEAEGFELHRVPFANPREMLDPERVEQAHGLTLGDYVRQVTGADHVVPFGHMRALIRDTGKFVPGYAMAADFVHVDHTREQGQKFAAHYCGAQTLARYPRAQIINIWIPMTPPPQDMPLAICDQRTVDPADWVVGKAVEPGNPDSFDNLTSVYNPDQRWYYFSDMAPEEMIVFKAWDNDPQAPIGCLHGAFRNDDAPADAVPRVSAEIRYFALYGS